MANSQFCTPKYEIELLNMDSEKCFIRDKSTREEEYLSHDLLVGADGIRSTIREALVKCHFVFELQISDIFNTFKAVHIQRPEAFYPRPRSRSCPLACPPSKRDLSA